MLLFGAKVDKISQLYKSYNRNSIMSLAIYLYYSLIFLPLMI